MRRLLRSIGRLFINEQALFVVVNVAVNFLLLFRSYVTMRTLDYADLGLVAVLQTMILLIGSLQMGVVNGGYRLLCSEDQKDSQSINNFVFTFIGIMAAGLSLAGFAVLFFCRDSQYTVIFGLALVAGILTIMKTWMTNYMIAKIMLRNLNWINLISAAASMIPLAFVSFHPLLMCLLSLVVQPFVFVTYLLIAEVTMRPTAPAFSMEWLGRTLSAGFLVFLTSLFLLANTQIERWSILSYMGASGLGRFYLALLFLNIYTLIPSSLDAIYLPKIVQSYVREDYGRMRAEMRRFFYVTLAYSAAAVIGVGLLARIVVGLLLPKYVGDLEFVYFVMPGVILFGLTSPFAVVFNVLIKYRFYFYAYSLGTILTAFLLGGYVIVAGSIDLIAVSIIKSAVYISMATVLLCGYAVFSRSDAVFRFDPLSLRRGATG